MTEDGSTADATRATHRGPRHAAPRRQLRSRLQLPAGKVLAIAAVPTALLMGAGYTPTLAMADDSTAKDTAQACATASDTPVPDASPSASADTGTKASATPTTATSSTSSTPAASASGTPTDTATPTPQASASADAGGILGGVVQSTTGKVTQAVQAPKASATPTTASGTDSAQTQGLLGGLLGGVGGLLTGGGSSGGSSASPSPSPSASSATPSPSASSATPTTDPSGGSTGGAGGGTGSSGGSAQGSGGATGGAGGPASRATAPVSTVGKAAKSVTDAVKDVTGAAQKTVSDATASPSSSATPGADALCATDASGLQAKAETGGGVIPDQSWTLKSSRLALHGAVFGGVVEVRTHTGATKRVLKFTVDSIDIGDLDMSTIESNKKTTHVKGRPGSTSTMRSGPITMYTESLTGHLSKVVGIPLPDLGPVTLTPDTLPKFLYDLIGSVPIPLDLEMTDVKAVQAGQFGGTLHIPGMHLYTDDEPYDG